MDLNWTCCFVALVALLLVVVVAAAVAMLPSVAAVGFQATLGAVAVAAEAEP